MTMPIINKLVPQGNTAYYDRGVQTMLETHMNWFRMNENTQETPVSPDLAVKWAGDFQGYLIEMGVRPCYHWLYMRVNDLYDYSSFGPNVKSLLHPPLQIADTLVQVYQTAIKKAT